MDENQNIIDALKGTMTHRAEQPNPALPYLNAAKGFYQGGLQGAADQMGVQTPEWSQKLGAVLSSPGANAALGVLGGSPKILHAGGNTVRMPPQQYLDLAMPFGHGGGPKIDWDKVNKLAKIGKWDTNPMLSVKQNNEGNFQVGIHDGRHRALAALQRGDNMLDVDIVRGQKFKRENPDVSDADMAKNITQGGILPENHGL